jgi:ribosomal protein S18 acetylase RimI-like enzyme
VGAEPETTVRLAGVEDAGAAARLLHEFNSEFGDPTPGIETLARRYAELIASRDVLVLLAGPGQAGFAQLRLRASLITGGRDAYLEELFVAPAQRGEGIGRALLEAAMETARANGADRIELGTSEDDRAAIGLYESTGFSNREGRRDGPRMLFYEREL